MKLNISLDGKRLLTISLAVLVFGSLAFVIAQDGLVLNFADPAPASVPNPGHSSADVVVNIEGTDMSLQQAIDGGHFTGGTTIINEASDLCVWIETDRVTRECKTISLLIDGRNICDDDEGCTYRAWRYDTDDVLATGDGTDNLFKQDGANWVDIGGDTQIGVQADNVNKVFRRVFNQSGIFFDDCCDPIDPLCDSPCKTLTADGGYAVVEYENSLDAVTFCERSTNYKYRIVFCDY